MYILKHFNDISQRLTAQGNVWKFISNFISNRNLFSFHYFKSSAGSFFLVFPNRLSATFDIQIDLKMKHS